MRVIAGAYRSRILTSPPGIATRPTSDRLRETLFNILGPRVAGSRFADLFAGTGAVGIEAISRGAAHTFFAEKSPAALRSLKGNLTNLKITQHYTLEERGTNSLLARLLTLEPLDVIFLDPPYEDEEAYTQTLGFLGSPAHASMLSPDAIILAEHATKGFQPLRNYGQLTRTRVYKQGDTTVSFYSPVSTDR
jgi:16S rRNA (guanine(966)-N(2))-methyltransferase RsmD